MGEKVLIKGNEAMAEAAIRNGCRFYFGYPITPQNEVPAYMSRRMPEVEGTFLQSESELAAINMVFGAAAAGARVMTSSSSPGISLKQEGISYISGAQLPCVIANVQRAGPGLGGIGPAQGDYFQATKGGGHGDYHLIVLAPSTAQEMADLTYDAFDYADKYRMPVMILADATVGQITEAVTLPDFRKEPLPEKSWALTGAKNRKPNVIRSYFGKDEILLRNNLERQKKYKQIQKKLVLYEEYQTSDAEWIFVAFGTSARITKSIVNKLRQEGKRVGLIRPITLWPFPSNILAQYVDNIKGYFVVEMNYGQMIEDVKLAVNGKIPVKFYGISSGYLPYEYDIIERMNKLL